MVKIIVLSWQPEATNLTKGLTPVVGNALSVELISASLKTSQLN